MKLRSLFMVVIVFALSACNLPSNVPTATPTLSLITPSVTQSPFTATPAITAPPSNTPPPPATSTPTVPVAFPKDQAVNCRLGPGIAWLALSGLNVGTNAQIVGKTAEGAWWYIVDPFNSGRKCWVAASVTNTSGNLANIPVVEAPTASVVNVTIDVEPDVINAAVCPGAASPIEFSGSIETNGPARVTWHFETQQSGALTTNITEFDKFGPIEFSTSYTPTLTDGTYWVRLVVTSPNAMQAETRYTINCP